MIEVTMQFASQEELLAFFTSRVMPANAFDKAEAPKPPKPARVAKSESPAATPTASATATTETTPAATAPSEPVTASPSEQPKAITLEEVRAQLAAISQAGKAAAVKGLIADYGVTALSAVPADKYTELLEKAAAL